MEGASLTALWWAVIFSGVYHGINPGMGWPLAVSATLMERKLSNAKSANTFSGRAFIGNDCHLVTILNYDLAS